MSTREFDLNIEKILEDWEPCHAVREIIANALDEQLLTSTADIEITKDDKGRWHIRDFGRGIEYKHLTQKENDEKVRDYRTIGKFGIGLKDALATFDRHGIGVTIKSKHGDISLTKTSKHGFEDMVTLHASISPPSDSSFQGTDVILEKIPDVEIQRGKEFFLFFSDEETIESTMYGDVIENRRGVAKIYINGVRVAEEENFLFSYNITSITSKIRKAMNRERTNVGRTAYTDRVKAILTSCESERVAKLLIEDLQKYETGDTHDEMSWLDIQEHAVRILNAKQNVAFLTPKEHLEVTLVEDMLDQGITIISIPERLRDRIKGSKDIDGHPIRELEQFAIEYEASFEFKFVDVAELTNRERQIFDHAEQLMDLVGIYSPRVKKILVSETMRKDLELNEETDGLWRSSDGSIIVKRDTLQSIEAFAGTLLHELAHAVSGAPDSSRRFEIELTRMIGILVSRLLTKRS
ncbi:MAG: ATP-binding protein [Candidatus Lokiarchaeota archaeon]|nr:ATP-binding protein [Candidatus Lokiarchaeota archaeon]